IESRSIPAGPGFPWIFPNAQKRGMCTPAATLRQWQRCAVPRRTAIFHECRSAYHAADLAALACTDAALTGDEVDEVAGCARERLDRSAREARHLCCAVHLERVGLPRGAIAEHRGAVADAARSGDIRRLLERRDGSTGQTICGPCAIPRANPGQST